MRVCKLASGLNRIQYYGGLISPPVVCANSFLIYKHHDILSDFSAFAPDHDDGSSGVQVLPDLRWGG